MDAADTNADADADADVADEAEKNSQNPPSTGSMARMSI